MPTAVDVGREFGFADGVVAADAALRQGATKQQLEQALLAMRSWPYVTRARAAVEVADGGRRAEVDIRVRRHLFEFDGKVKYVGRERGGVAERSPDQVLWDEKRREDWVRNHDGGYGMSRVVWSELFGRARDETKRRLYREFTESQSRYGHLG